MESDGGRLIGRLLHGHWQRHGSGQMGEGEARWLQVRARSPPSGRPGKVRQRHPEQRQGCQRCAPSVGPGHRLAGGSGHQQEWLQHE
eukprot:15320059-Alexandrium_andersonii.AAC.1